jgi:hypothetical protein
MVRLKSNRKRIFMEKNVGSLKEGSAEGNENFFVMKKIF